MIQLAAHDLCNGCQACGNVCSRDAIMFVSDKEGFLRPVVDVSRCTGCHLCEKACPVLHQSPPREPLSVYAAMAKDCDVRMNSSSGGVFTLLAKKTIAAGGIVFGAAIRDRDLMVAHCSAENDEELARLCGSKYVQSDAGDVYRQVKKQLQGGREVLFSGTPCQIAALKCVLGKPYDNLLCLDVICHAVPSPLAWRKFLEKRAAALAKGRDSARPETVIDRRISFRRKNCGWKRYSLSLRFANDKEYLQDLHHDSFLRGFLFELYNRPSCHVCKYRELRSGSDITIADYWGVEEKFPDMDDDLGTSIVMVSTPHGQVAFNGIAGEVRIKESDFGDVCRTNPAVIKSSLPNKKRGAFFKAVAAGEDFDRVVEHLLRRPFWRRCGSLVKRMVKRLLSL